MGTAKLNFLAIIQQFEAVHLCRMHPDACIATQWLPQDDRRRCGKLRRRWWDDLDASLDERPVFTAVRSPRERPLSSNGTLLKTILSQVNLRASVNLLFAFMMLCNSLPCVSRPGTASPQSFAIRSSHSPPAITALCFVPLERNSYPINL